MKLSNKIKYILGAPKSAILSKKYAMPHVMNDTETLEYLLTHHCSICRYGDGEFNLMRGVGIKFQENDAVLNRRLCEIARAGTHDDILICLPNIFSSLDHFSGESKHWWKNYLRCTRGYWYRTFSGGSVFGDTNVTRFYVENKNKDRDEYVQNLKKIWEGKKVLIVEGRRTRMGMGNDLFAGATSLKRLICPSQNAFSVYDKILNAVKREVEAGDYDLMICALGPTATVLCYDMADTIQSLDLGHIDVEYEWYLAKAETKQAIKNKSVTEVTDECSDECDEIYRSQLIGEIE